MGIDILGDSLNWEGSIPNLREAKGQQLMAVYIYRLYLVPRNPSDQTHAPIAFPPILIRLTNENETNGNGEAAASAIVAGWSMEPEHAERRPDRRGGSLDFRLPGTSYAGIHMIKDESSGATYFITDRARTLVGTLRVSVG
jgi:hypothetical protein